MRISAIVHTRNAAATLDRALGSLAWAAERIVVDMASTDDTRAIAARHGARVLDAAPAPRVDGIRTRYLAEARHEWILVLDADEYLAADAAERVAAVIAEHGAAFDAFAIPRFNAIGGQVLRGAAWYPDHQIRLFRRGTVEWDDTTHQPPRVVPGLHRLHHLQPPGCLHIHHDNYRDLRDVIERQVRYALHDRYPDDPETFDFGAALGRAYAALAARHDPADGELSHALALIMAWDEIVRGLLHWEALGRRPPLSEGVALPIAASADPARGRRRDWRLRARAHLRARLVRYPRLLAAAREARRRARGGGGR